MTDERVTFGTLLPSLTTDPLAVDVRPVFAFVLIKGETADGPTWSFRTSSAPNREELLGALCVQVELIKQGLLDDWDLDDDAAWGLEKVFLRGAAACVAAAFSLSIHPSDPVRLRQVAWSSNEGIEIVYP